MKAELHFRKTNPYDLDSTLDFEIKGKQKEVDESTRRIKEMVRTYFKDWKKVCES